MPLTIQLEYRGFSLRATEPGRGAIRAHAANLLEVLQTVRHYYGEGHRQLWPRCPFCRRTREEAARELRRLNRERRSKGA